MKAPGFNPCAYEVKTWFQSFAFEFNLYRYAGGLNRELVSALDAAMFRSVGSSSSGGGSSSSSAAAAAKKVPDRLMFDTVGLYKLEPS